MSFSLKDLEELKIALNYMLVSELKKVCERLHIACFGKKGDVIRQIIHFVSSGKTLSPQTIPDRSKAKKGTNYPLAPTTLILLGSYKNDLQTRLFMKRLVGEHFHFTAFGQDWIKSRWLQGNPPTYREFAHFWQKEYEARKKRPATPKKEWAYLNFIQQYLAKHPKGSKQEIAKAWQKERLLQARKADTLLKKAYSSPNHRTY